MQGAGFSLVMNEQIVIGGGVALLCGLGLWHDRWLLTRTSKGRWLIARLGADRALWTLRALLAGGVAFGVLVATDVIRPVKW